MDLPRIGLLVNPIAGMGGRVGLKGTDSEAILEKARALGAEPVAPERAKKTLRALTESGVEFELLTGPASMGEHVARAEEFEPAVVGSIAAGRISAADEATAVDETTAADTKDVAMEMMDRDVDVLVFAGGDGTARDVADAVGDSVPVVGVPTGVKMYSAVFAPTPRDAGELVGGFLQGRTDGVQLREVMDIDEADFRDNRLSATLHGYLTVPYARKLVQNPKSGGTGGDEAQRREIAREIGERMDPETLYVIGPGTTTKRIADELGIESTLLGVDAVRDSRLVGADLNESQLLEFVRGGKSKIIVGVIGGQGCIFGRGNQQISPAVLRVVGVDDVVVVATRDKLLSLENEALFVDTNDAELDEMFEGYRRVVTGYHEEMVVRVSG